MENESVSADVSAQTESTTNDSQNGEQSANQEAKQAESAKAAQIRRLGDGDLDALVTVKVNGETKEIPLRDAIKFTQLEGASTKKMQEAAKLMNQVQSIIQMAKNDPKKFLKETGIDPYDFAESTLAEKFELMQLSPEQKELMELKREKQERQEREKLDSEAKEKEHMSRVEAEEMGKLDQTIGEAWKESGLPKSRKVFADIAFEMLSASKRGQDLTAKEAASKVKANFVLSTQEMFSQMDAAAIHEALGKDILKKIREYDVKRVSVNPVPSQKQSQGQRPSSKAEKTYLSEQEYRRAVEENIKNLRD